MQSKHCTENPIYVFPEVKLRGLVPNSYIHVSCRQNDPENIFLFYSNNLFTKNQHIYQSSHHNLFFLN
jgi:hypothetical protein